MLTGYRKEVAIKKHRQLVKLAQAAKVARNNFENHLDDAVNNPSLWRDIVEVSSSEAGSGYTSSHAQDWLA